MSPSRRLAAYILRYRSSFLLGLGSVVIAASVSLAGPWVLKYAVDDLRTGVTMEKVRLYAGALLALALVGGVFRFLMRRVIMGVARSIEYDMRNDFFAQLQRFELAYFQQRRTGDLMSRATNDLNAVRMMIGPAAMFSANTALTLVVGIALMISMHPWLALVALLPLPVVSLSVRHMGAAVHRRFEGIQEQLADISAVMQETLAGVRVVRAYRQEAPEVARFGRANLEYLRRNRGLIGVMALFSPIIGLFMGTSALLVLWLGSREVVAGRMSVGELVAFNGYLVLLSWPVIAFGWVSNLIQRGTASWKRMVEVWDTPVGIDEPATGGRLPAGPSPLDGDIEFRHLTFTYGDAVVLQDVDVRLAAGTTTAVVGATGSGKSTLLSLLPRLHEAPEGTVFIGGVDVRDLPLGLLRRSIGFVQQEPFLFSASVADNVAFGAMGAAVEPGDVEAAAAVARLDQDILDLPQGYQTMVGERGVTLSGGQKQRVALARALMVEPRILILDDALSAVDTYTEEEILRGLRAAMQRRTSLIVSHRISTVRHADLILVLDGGRIVEQGTHDSLVGQNGAYAALYRKQLLEDELEAS